MKTFLLDTNVFLHDPQAMFKFDDNKIIIPFEVLEELDGLKNRKDNLGFNARETIRVLDSFVNPDEESQEQIKSNIEFVNSSKLMETIDRPDITRLYYSDGVDNKLLAVALVYGPDVIFVSKDINSRLKAKAVGIKSEDYYSDKIDVSSIEKRSKKTIIINNPLLIDKLYKVGYIEKSELNINIRGLYDNLPVILKDTTEQHSALCYFRENKFIIISPDKFKKQNINPIGVDQIFALEFLFNPDIVGVAIFGGAGSGKSYITIASGLAQLPEQYKKIVITKPVISVGRDIGYLPGPQPLWSKVLTPNGWKRMGEMEVGDEVITPGNNTATVEQIHEFEFPQRVYRIMTDTNKVAYASSDHLWHVYIGSQDEPALLTTEQMIDKLDLQFRLPRPYLDINDDEDDIITSIEFVSEEDVKCITLDNEEGLYITDDYIVTHNSVNEKMSPWLASYMDNLAQILFKWENSQTTKNHPQYIKKSSRDYYNDDAENNMYNYGEMWEYLLESGIIEIQPISYIRGRNFVDSFVIIDEAHNMSVHEIKTVLTRIGAGSKVVILGDIEQIDTPYLDKYSNGLVQAIAKLRNISEFAYIKLNKVIRSPFVEKVVKLL